MFETHPLVQFWLDIGKVRRERKTADPASPYIYFFIREDGLGEVKLINPWKDFWYTMDIINYTYFLHDTEFVEGPLNPWKSMNFVGLEFRHPELDDGKKATYEIIGRFE